MICSKLDNPEVRYNYEFIHKTDKVKIFNNDFYKVISYEDWCKEYCIVDKWKTI